MKKIYIAPQSAVVNLFVEESLLSASKVISVDESKTIEGSDARSLGFEWSDSSWDEE